MVSEKKRLLLVEDEFLLAMNEKAQLEKYGYDVVIVNSGDEAIGKLTIKVPLTLS